MSDSQIEIYTDALHRIAYSTDASAYREVPVGVAYPQCGADIKYLIETASKRNTCIIPRAGGTSIAGQVVGKGIVLDVSRYLNKILEINADEKWARVQPGVVLDELNIACKPYGLFFSPETSTSNRCCIGGMFGNNSCGSHSLIYGSTRHHILEANGILSDGSTEHFKEYTIEELEERFGKAFWKTYEENTPLIQRIYSQLINYSLDRQTVNLIEESYPDKTLRRRSCGYAIDEVIEDLADESKPLEVRRINLCKLLCGSEGTLAFISEIKVNLDVLPQKEKMALCIHCDALEKCYLANIVCLRHFPDAVELIDGHILELSKQNGMQQSNRFFVSGEPAGLLVAELSADNLRELEEKASALEKELLDGDNALAYTCTRVCGKDISKVWSLRKAGLGLLSGMKGDAKPIGVIEDTAVEPKRLPAYLKDFREMLHKLELECVFYGHISTGELHLRPIINIKTESGRRLFREVAHETALLVKKYKGSLSGEHGDGRLRGEFIPLLYGDAAYGLMCDVKACWDPHGVFNMGKIVNTPPMDCFLRYELGQSYEVEREVLHQNTYFNWKVAFDECRAKYASGVSSQIRALMCTIEQCNGAGDCRKSNLIGGLLCPAYKVSNNEIESTRARANILRELLTRGWRSEVFEGKLQDRNSVFDIPELKEVLDSCLACKGCKSECPSNVDMTRLRAELLQHLYDAKGMPFRSYMIARMAVIERMGSAVAPLYNFFAQWNVSSYVIKKILRFSTARNIPALSHRTMRQLVKRAKGKIKRITTGRKVYLFADEFTNYQEAELGLTFVRLLLALGYEVEIPQHVESGRAAISKGDLKYAKKCARKNLALLKDVITVDTPLVGIEPSCILSFRDEYPDLVSPNERKEAQALARNCLLYDEFFFSEIKKGYISSDSFKSDNLEIWLHGHCHQKAIVGIEITAKILNLIPNTKVNVIPSGCCGMAGSFGYEKEHYKTSLQIGEMILFPAVRKAVSQSALGKYVVISAPGTSCRQQIKDGTGITALHPIEILYNHLKI